MLCRIKLHWDGFWYKKGDTIVQVKQSGVRTTKSAQTRERIIEAARKLFREREYVQVGVREISKAAGVSASVFYYYFNEKKDVLLACFNRNDERFGEELERIITSEKDVCDRIHRFLIRVMVPIVQADGKQLTRYRMFELKQNSQPDSMLYRNLEIAIEHGQKIGEVTTRVSAASITSHILTVFRGAMYEWCISEEENSFAASASANVLFALNAFRV